MEGIAAFCSLAAFVVAWWGLNKLAKKRGWKWWQRHLSGFVAGMVAMFVVTAIVMPPLPLPAPAPAAAAPPPPATATAKVGAAEDGENASSDRSAAEDASDSDAKEDVRALAAETLAFIDEARDTLEFAIAAKDGQAVMDDVEVPAMKVMTRWNNIQLANRFSYESCYEALHALYFYADNLNVSRDSADRRRAMAHDWKRHEDSLAKCRVVAS